MFRLISNSKWSPLRGLALCFAIAIGLAGVNAKAGTVSNGLTLAQQPIYVGAPVPPIVMLDVTKDHQLYYRAFNDYTDLDQNKTLDSYEVTYNPSFSYDGYFDPVKCYTYNATNGYFQPVSVYYVSVNGNSVMTPAYCNQGGTSGQWSGNFMNWMSMSRMDILRKVLYGGLRSTDTTSTTVLERAYFPFDAHSWVKFYNGSDLPSLTPFTQVSTPTATATAAFNTSSIDASNGATVTFNMTSTQMSALNIAYGDQISAVVTNTPTDFLEGAINGMTSSTISIFVPGINHSANSFTSAGFNVSSGSTAWTLTNRTYQGVSFCNTDYAVNTSSQAINTATNPPLVRVVRGDYRLWASSERIQCVYSTGNTSGSSALNNGEIGFTLPFYKGASSNQNNNGNLFAVTNLPSSSTHAPASRGLFVSGMSGTGKPDYADRVQVCVAGLIGTETCRAYPVGGATVTSSKPYGLLQQYGEGASPQIRFGLFTGSYDKNISGGVLRRNAEATLSSTGFADNEIDPATGEFVTTANGFSANTKGIIWTINHLRQYNYYYPYVNGQGNDGYMSLDNCTYQLMGMAHSGGGNVAGGPGQEGSCASWGNPISEMYLETLRYLAGKSPTSVFLPNSNGDDATLQLPTATWVDPLTSGTYCTPLNIVNFSASVNSYDYYTAALSDNSAQYAGISDLAGAGTGPSGVDYWTDLIGTYETQAAPLGTIPPGSKVLIGATDVNPANGHCDAKSFNNFSSVYGICPEAPSLQGSYLISGLAYYAHTNHIRSDFSVPATDLGSLKVNTISVQLASSLPVITVPVIISGVTHTVTITPAYSLNVNNKMGTGTLVNFFPIGTPTTSTNPASDGSYGGTYYVDWEDSNQGGDYDQDLWGFITYKVNSSGQIIVSNQVAWAASANGQAFGFNISGTNHDGPHFFTGAYASQGVGFSFSEPTAIAVTPNTSDLNSSGGCQTCEQETGGLVHSMTFAVSSTPAATQLQDPLYYAAKWGGFKDNGSGTITTATQFDSIDNTTGLNSSDGIPDNYFYVINPSRLGPSLSAAFLGALKVGSSSALAANSTSWQGSSIIYQAGFNAKYWSGWIKAQTLATNGLTGTSNFTANTTTVFNTDDFTLFGANGQPTAASRTIITDYNGAGEAFEWNLGTNHISTAQQAVIQGSGTATNAANVFAWLRGDLSNEGAFRTRFESRIGDISDSSPMYVGAPSGQYDNPQSLFRNAYVNDPTWWAWSGGLANRSPMLYVGANDGMLHGFWTQTSTTPNTTAGAEGFAFVPNAVFSKLAGLSAVNYTHYFTVDGSPNVADAYLQKTNTTSAWHTVLVGGLGAGGRGVYALDVTNPANFSEANAANIFLWEFTNSDDPDLGYTFSKPMIAKMNNGHWAAIFGNGYFQTGDTATTAHSQLFIVFLDAARTGNVWNLGTDYIKIDTASGTALTVGSDTSYSGSLGTAGSGGLSTVTGIDLDSNGTVDSIYGGDLKGNVWKFDVSSATPSNWKVAFSSGTTGLPLTTLCYNRTTSALCTNTTQPIFNKPTLTVSPNLDGVMVYVGVGEYIQPNDANNITSSNPDSMYGIYDNAAYSPPYGNLGALAAAHPGSLLTQTISTVTNSSGPNYRTVTSYPFVWVGASGTPANYVWLEDLPASGERVTGNSQLQGGVLFYNTYIPSTQTCTAAGDGWTMAVSYQNGGLLSNAEFDTNNDGLVNASDPPSAGINTGASMGGGLLFNSTASNQSSGILSSGTDGTIKGVAASTKPTSAPRIGWRELFK